MNVTVEIIEREISHIDFLLIMHIKSLRQEKKWSQQELSMKMGVSRSFVGNVENLIERHKYSIRHLTLLQKAFNKTSISELFSFHQPEYDRIKLRIEINKTDNNNRIIKSKLIEIIPLDLL